MLACAHDCYDKRASTLYSACCSNKYIPHMIIKITHIVIQKARCTRYDNEQTECTFCLSFFLCY